MKSYKIIETDSKEIDGKIYHRIESNHPTVKIGERVYVNISCSWFLGQNTVIGDDVTIRAGAYIGSYTQIGSNVEIGETVHIDSFVKIYQNVKIGYCSSIYMYAEIGEGSTIGQFCRIESEASVGSGIFLPEGGTIPDGMKIQSNRDFKVIGTYGKQYRHLTLFKNSRLIRCGCTTYTFDGFKKAVHKKYGDEGDYPESYPVIEEFFGSPSGFYLSKLYKNVKNFLINNIWKNGRY